MSGNNNQSTVVAAVVANHRLQQNVNLEPANVEDEDDSKKILKNLEVSMQAVLLCLKELVLRIPNSNTVRPFDDLKRMCLPLTHNVLDQLPHSRFDCKNNRLKREELMKEVVEGVYSVCLFSLLSTNTSIFLSSDANNFF